MLRRRYKSWSWALPVLDGLITWVSAYCGALIRFGSQDWYNAWKGVFTDPILPVAIFSLIRLLFLYVNGAYHSTPTNTPWLTMRSAMRTEFGFVILSLGALTAFKVLGLSRLYLVWLFGIQAVLTLAVRFALLVSARMGRADTRVLIVGAGSRGRDLLHRFRNHPELRAGVVGFLDDNPSLQNSTLDGVRVLGLTSHLLTVIHHNVVDEVFIALPQDSLEKVRELAATAENEGKVIHIVADIVKPRLGQAYVTDFYDLPLLTLVNTPNSTLALWAKAAIDYVVAAVATILTLPIMLVTAVAIKADSPGPVFFVQERVGLHGRTFRLYKFRSMVKDAEKLKAQLVAQNEADGPVFKIWSDPRITRVGRLIRKTSIDELPQLLNVIKGEISLVGPRPALPMEVEQYSPWQRRRLSMKPGITGLWQVSSRNHLSFNDWVRLDLEYIDHWSLTLDLSILLRTVPAAFKGV